MLLSSKCERPEELKDEYLSLLDQELGEQDYQAFIEKNTFLVPREFLQNHGLHFDLVFRKMPFGSDMCCDFMYLSKSTVRWNCVLIEIEKPQSKYFKANSEKFHPDFVSAQQQINDWRAWFDVTANKESFLSNALGFVRTPLGHTPTDIKYVLVHGRRREIENNAQRLAGVRAVERPDFRIMSFDSLAEQLATKDELYIAAKKKTYIQILSEKFVSETMFGWLKPEMIKINDTLRADMMKFYGKINSYQFIGNGEKVRSVDHYLDSTA